MFFFCTVEINPAKSKSIGGTFWLQWSFGGGVVVTFSKPSSPRSVWGGGYILKTIGGTWFEEPPTPWKLNIRWPTCCVSNHQSATLTGHRTTKTKIQLRHQSDGLKRKKNHWPLCVHNYPTFHKSGILLQKPGKFCFVFLYSRDVHPSPPAGSAGGIQTKVRRHLHHPHG